MDDLYQHGIQSLIVEGGCQTHESFIQAGLWDEIRMEVAPITISDGTRAPQLPSDIRLLSKKEYGENTMTIFSKKSQ
jgi:diaminohydroxyphosphoribosylaminopyrimidine deaminase/5-amino-6-(5-phosphoribosylamino)uracil reductase